jgi:zinc transporter ZupT
MQEQETKDRHPIITLGLLTAGTQMGSALIQRMGRHPVILFAMGATAGVYTYKNRKEILAEAQQLKKQTKALISRKSD